MALRALRALRIRRPEESSREPAIPRGNDSVVLHQLTGEFKWQNIEGPYRRIDQRQAASRTVGGKPTPLRGGTDVEPKRRWQRIERVARHAELSQETSDDLTSNQDSRLLALATRSQKGGTEHS